MKVTRSSRSPTRRRRWRSAWRIGPFVPMSAIAVEHPFDERAFALPVAVRIVEALTVEMICERTAITRRSDESPFDRRGRRCRPCDEDRCFRAAAHPIYPKRPAAEIGRGEGSLTEVP